MEILDAHYKKQQTKAYNSLESWEKLLYRIGEKIKSAPPGSYQAILIEKSVPAKDLERAIKILSFKGYDVTTKKFTSLSQELRITVSWK